MIFPADDVIARGRRTVIRRKRQQDVAEEYAWRSDPELAQFDASRAVQAAFEDYQRNWSFDYRFTDAAARTFAVEDENGCHIGNVMYYNLDSTRREAEIGISIGDRRGWSRGYGADALQAIVGRLFATLDINRLYLHTLDWNVRAQKAFAKAGFEVCGTSWRDGHTFIVMELGRGWLAPTTPALSHAVA